MTSDRADRLRKQRALQVDGLNEKLFEVAMQQDHLDKRREKHASDQLKQLELDRAQTVLDFHRKRFVKLKEESAAIDIPE